MAVEGCAGLLECFPLSEPDGLGQYDQLVSREVLDDPLPEPLVVRIDVAQIAAAVE